MFIHVSRWEEEAQENAVCFFLFSTMEFVRIECNGVELEGKGERPYCFPPGRIRIRVFPKENFVTPILDQCGFFPQMWRGIFVIRETGIFTYCTERHTVLPEKGQFRIINLLKESLSVRRIGGKEVFSNIKEGEATPYRLAGVGLYHFEFFCQNRKVLEKDLKIEEGSCGSLLVDEKNSMYLKEFYL